MEKSFRQNQYRQEMQQAIAARADGNEGRARVCARRAASIAIREYLDSRKIPYISANAYDLISTLLGLESAPERAREIAAHLLVRVSEDFTLPDPLDLLAETQDLAEILEFEAI